MKAILVVFAALTLSACIPGTGAGGGSGNSSLWGGVSRSLER